MEFLRRLFFLFRRRRFESELGEEFRAHVEMKAAKHRDAGVSPGEARFAALREFGNPTLLTEASRDAWGFRWLEQLAQDLRYAVRTFRRSPRLTLMATLSLALGIGANTAMFSLVNAFLLRLLPVNSPEELVFVRARLADGSRVGSFPLDTFEQFRDRNRSFSGVFAIDGSNVNAVVNGQPELISVDFVSGGYHSILGVSAMLGRTLTPEDDQRGSPPVAVISYGYWKRRFGLDPAVLGKSILLKDVGCTIVGVTPPAFLGLRTAGEAPPLAVPLALQPRLALKDHDTFEIVARLTPGVTPDRARADLDVVYHQVLPGQVASRAPRIEIEPAQRGYVNPQSRFVSQLRILQVIAGLVLLIACANVANLVLARGLARSREMAVRAAIGASRARLVRQLLAESLLLAAAGGVIGFVSAGASVELLLALVRGRSVPFALEPDAVMLGFTAGVSLLTGVLCGLLPALRATRVDLTPTLKENARRHRAGRSSYSLNRAFVVSQVAVSLVILISAGLLVRSLQRLGDVDLGFRQERLLVAWVYPTLVGYEGPGELRLYGELLERLNATPGVRSASLSRYSVLRKGRSRNLVVEGGAPQHDAPYVLDAIGPRFFETLGIPVLLGREFQAADNEAAPKTVIVNESLARKYFAGENPIGRRIGIGVADRQIVGVAGDMRFDLRDETTPPAVYIPYTQADPRMLGQMLLKVRTAGEPLSMAAAVRQAVAAVDKDLPLVELRSQEQETELTVSGERSLAKLLGGFGALALFLAMGGLYGTMSYAVVRRTKEIGVRMALGASGGAVTRMVLAESLGLTLAGAAIGIPLALVAARLLEGFLFGVGALDPSATATAAAVLLATAVVAGYLPARRASRIDPIVTLKYE